MPHKSYEMDSRRSHFSKREYNDFGSDSNEAQNSPRCAAEYYLMRIDQQVSQVRRATEVCLRELGRYRHVLHTWCVKATAYERAFYEEQQLRFQCQHAYQLLRSRYLATEQDLASIASQYRSVQKDLDCARTAIFAQEAVAEVCEQCNVDQNRTQDIGKDTTESQLESRVIESEGKRAAPGSASVTAADLILLLEETIALLKDVTIQRGLKDQRQIRREKR
ncbi:hypothetical protein B0J11DRAFT_585954 [Dendryphion nanum]|uniref:Uncharacterized protein n=1 Tax=Dendryphion nanum TaxID=256645 RepID=A0A9P9D1W2_9PLEO|nr:hypothetical protein B0J11DRAFT_585954 [Dendryphion nanum]